MTLGVVAEDALEAKVAVRALRAMGFSPVLLDGTSVLPSEIDAVFIVTGPETTESVIREAAERGLPIFAVGDGFAGLCEMGLLDGALAPNDVGFVGREQRVRLESKDSVWTCAVFEGERLTLALRTACGRFVADPEVLERLESNHQVVLRFIDDLTGSDNAIAGITNERGNIVGITCTPQYNVEAALGGMDGLRFSDSLKRFLARAGR